MIPCLELNNGSLRVADSSKCLKEALKALLQLIPLGNVTTYKEIGNLLALSPREVGKLLKGNDEPIVVPCHRVVKSDGRVGGYTFRSRSNSFLKEKLLRIEGVFFKGTRVSSRSYYGLTQELLG